MTRASDAERSSTLDELGRAMSDGRLGVGEYDERSAAASTAQTRDELVRLTADLPGVPDGASVESVEEKGVFRKEWGYFAFGAFAMSAVWGAQCVVKGHVSFYWPLVPLTIWAVILISYLFWPSDDE